MKITRRESIKTIVSVLGTPFLLGREAVAADQFTFGEGLSGYIAVDSYRTDVYPPRTTRAIYDFKRGEETAKKSHEQPNISFNGKIVIKDLDRFEDKRLADFEGKLTYNGEENPIRGQG